MAKRPRKQDGKAEIFGKDEGDLVLGKKNYLMLSLGVVLISLGFVSLSRGSITAAPILLVLGYCVVIPLAIVLKP